MISVSRLALATFITGAIIGCQSSDSPPSCSLNDPAELSSSSWPKFRHDRYNTGAINQELPTGTPAELWVFPPQTAAGAGAFAASPALNSNDELIYIGSTNGTLYVINTGNTASGCTLLSLAGRVQTSFTLTAQFGITSTALIGVRDGADAIFVGGGDGHLYGLYGTGATQQNYWPFPSSGGSIATSPNISVNNGIIYSGSLSALFFGVCPNGIQSFTVSTVAVGSSPAVGPDGSVYFGANDGLLRSVGSTGAANWAFAVGTPILTAPVVEVDGTSTEAIYVANNFGRIFKVTSSGQADATFRFAGPNGGAVGSILSSPALAGNHLYFGSDDGRIYAFDKDTGQVVWAVQTAGAVTSSPAVASAAGTLPVIVVGSNDGNIYFVTDDGTQTPPVQAFPIPSGAAVRSSPAIDRFGTVYVGADDGRVYAIGAPPVCGTTPMPTPSPTPTPS